MIVLGLCLTFVVAIGAAVLAFFEDEPVPMFLSVLLMLAIVLVGAILKNEGLL